MKVLIQAATVHSPDSPFHLKQQNILIENGVITYIGDDKQDADSIIDLENLHVSVGWIDLMAFTGEPGFEYKEDINSLAAAAAKGGFTEVLCLPNTDPVNQTKGSVQYLINRSKYLPVTLHPIAAVSMGAEGKELSEMIDLHQAGAVAFSDGLKPLQGADITLRALQYMQMFQGLLMNRPENSQLAEKGQMHEGEVSTSLGMKGIPSLAEEIMITRDLQLLRYAGGKMHFSLVSTVAGIEAIRKAKAEGLQVTCDVASYQVAFTDATIEPFDTNFKASPPFRSASDVDAIIQGLKDGTIDAMVSAHIPQDEESKKLEYDLADFGIINIETAFSVANTHLVNDLGLDAILEKFVSGPRKLLSMEEPKLAVGQPANLTLFQPNTSWVPAPEDTLSKSKNSPFWGKELKGKVTGIIHKGQVVLH